MKCSSCQEDLPAEYAQCTSAKACKLHFGGCAGISETSWKKPSTNKNSWKCGQCRREVKNDTVSAEELRAFMSEVKNQLKSVQRIDDLMEMVKDLKNTVEFISNQYDQVVEDLKAAEHGRKEQQDMIAELKKQNEDKDQVIKTLQIRMRDTEQYNRNRNIEISGVEARKDEDLKRVMRNIAEKINVQFSDDDIDVIHRLPSRRGAGAPRIVAQFTSRSVRNLWLKKKNTGGALTSKEVVPNGESAERVYLNTHLTPDWKDLLWRTKQAGRPLGFKIIWYQDFKIIAKKDVTDQHPIYITSFADLGKFGSSH